MQKQTEGVARREVNFGWRGRISSLNSVQSCCNSELLQLSPLLLFFVPCLPSFFYLSVYYVKRGLIINLKRLKKLKEEISWCCNSFLNFVLASNSKISFREVVTGNVWKVNIGNKGCLPFFKFSNPCLT